MFDGASSHFAAYGPDILYMRLIAELGEMVLRPHAHRLDVWR